MGGAGAASLGCSGAALCRPKTKGFLSYLGNPELLQSTTCQLVMRSQEVSLAAGRGGWLGFVFLLSLSGIALSSCYSRNGFALGDAHAVLTEI